MNRDNIEAIIGIAALFATFYALNFVEFLR